MDDPVLSHKSFKQFILNSYEQDPGCMMDNTVDGCGHLLTLLCMLLL